MKLDLRSGSRSKILAGLMFSIMALFIARLFYLQVIQHDYYVGIAKAEQVKRLTIPSKRGLIYALDGETPVPMVMNQIVYTVFADPQMVNDSNKVMDVIRQVAGGNARPNLQDLLNKKESRYQILATKITRVQADKIKSEELKGIGFQENTQRVYPEGQLAAQTLGFVNDDGIGQYGVEEKLNDRLTGKDGLLQSVTDVSNVPLTIGNNNINRPAVNGENIVLSIDRNIQSYTEKALADGLKRTGADRGSVIVMNPQNGQVMAMANLPTYSPAEFGKVTDASAFNNAVVSSPYEPGSDVKTLTMATGIDKGVVTAESTYNNTDYIQVDDRVISNATKGHTGNITFQDALTWSLNTGFVTVAQRLGDGNSITKGARDTMYDYFTNKFKLGHLTGVEVAGEAAGTVISPDNVDGNAVRYSNMSFGQGLDATMVQVSAAFCSLVNGGKYFKPTVIAGTISKDGIFDPSSSAEPSVSVSASTANQVREMTHVVRTSSASNIDTPGYYIGGKTGTSQVIRDGQYADDEAVGTYLGYGGSEETSNYVIMAQLSAAHRVMRGAQEVGPIFTNISNWMLNYLKVQPKG
jgi:cell division protein FtsI/penicillin-binding protein 2